MKLPSLLSLMLMIGGCVASSPEVSPAFDDVAQTALTRGVVHLRAHEFDKSDAAFRAALEIKVSAEGYDGLGCVALLEKRYADAERWFLKARAINPSYTRATMHMALLMEIYGDAFQAEQLYQMALREDPTDVTIRNNYAVFLAEKERGRGRATRELFKAAAIDPHPKVIRNLQILKYTLTDQD